jgi:putative RNA 2'-phosphotransferase
MTPKQLVSHSKFLSLVLRHQPETIGITLDSAGWVAVEDLLAGLAKHGQALSRTDLEEIVRTSDKQRFALSPDGRRIRANQGHSIEVELDHAPAVPPELLYHGTAAQFLPTIRERGLCKMQRHHVHLSAETEMTLKVGARRGRPILLIIRAGDMHRAGHAFFLTPNQVWLTDQVLPEFIEFPPATSSST